MRVAGIDFSNKKTSNTKKPLTTSSNVAFQGNHEKIKNHEGKTIAKIIDPKGLLTVSDQSNKKVGTAIVLTPNDPKYSNLKILVKDGKSLEAPDFKVVVDPKKLNGETPYFAGTVYGSIGDTNYPDKMKAAYQEFYTKGMYNSVVEEFKPDKSQFKNDYNFFVPTDGDGTRFKDYANLQGGICKPAAILPGTLNNEPLKLIHATLINFAKTGMADEGVEFVKVDKARGSAFAFLEGLKNDKIPTDKPIVFCWGDNFSDINLNKLIQYHEDNNSGFTVLGVPAPREKMKALGAIYLEHDKGMEMQGFEEKPQDEDQIDRSQIPGSNKCLASVGPYILSPQVLKRLKADYTENPEKFNNPDKGVDFSDKILKPMVEKFKNGEIKDEEGNPFKMMAYVKPEDESWSDLGKTTDLANEFKALKRGSYAGMPEEVKTSISENVNITKGVISTDPKAKAKFDKFCNEYDVHISGPGVVVVSTLGE